MADIPLLALADVGAVNFNGTGDIDYIVSTDAVFYINTNRPTRNLAARDELLQDKVNAILQIVNAADGSMADFAERLDVSLEADGTLKSSAIPDVSALADAITETELHIGNTNATILDSQAAAVRAVCPSGFNKFGGEKFSGDTDLSLVTQENGIYSVVTVAGPGLYLGGDNDVVGERGEFVINGYKIKPRWALNSGFYANLHNSNITIPAAPATGARQDLVFIEAWKEEVPKTGGAFFPFGNTQYGESNPVDGATLSDSTVAENPAYFTGSAGVYLIPVENATDAFISNPDHNISILKNGNYMQIRYRIRVEADIEPYFIDGGHNAFIFAKDLTTGTIRPQGQLASAPARGQWITTEGVFIKQGEDEVAERTLIDSGLLIGGQTPDMNTKMSPIPGLSLDGFTYAIPICTFHRRNTGVFGVANLNGTAAVGNANGETFEQGAILRVSTNTNIGTAYGSLVYDDNDNIYKTRGVGASDGWMQVVTVNGSQPSSGSFWSDSAKTVKYFDFASSSLEASYNYSESNVYVGGRPDGLWANVIDSRDITDLRHKVALDGDLDIDTLYQKTLDSILNDSFRNAWEELEAFDNDGNGTGTVDTDIYGSTLLESLGLGATVPDAGINTDITKRLLGNNGVPLAFNGARTVFSDKESVENFKIYIEDQSDGSASKTHHSEDAGVVSYNATTHAIEIDLTQHSSYLGDLALDPQLLDYHTPDIRWSNGAKVAGVLTRTNTYNWSFEIKQYGEILLTISAPAELHIGDVYRDSTGKDWVFTARTSSTDTWMIADYSSGNDGSVLPLVSTTMTKQSGLGPTTFVVHGSTAPAYRTTADYQLGYDNTAHSTPTTDPIYATYKIKYQAYSGAFKRIPSNSKIISGTKLFLDSEEITTPINMEPALAGAIAATTGISSNGSINLNGFVSSNSVLAGDTTGVDSGGIGSHSVLKDGVSYKMWYHALEGGVNSICYATSTDGIDWDKHGIVLTVGGGGDPDELGAEDPSVIKDGATYKMWYTGRASGNVPTICYATSSDGITWAKQGKVIDVAVISASTNGAYYPHVIKDGSTYRIWYTGYNTYTSIVYADSADGVTWANTAVALDKISVYISPYENTSVLAPCVIKDGSVYKMFYRMIGTYTTGAIGYAISKDGINWSRSENPIMEPTGVSGDYNAENLVSLKVIKDGASYKMWSLSYGGSYNSIGYGVLAMTDPANTGSSVTGTYTNASPQINLGFKSTDAVVLFYERKARQLGSAIGTAPNVEYDAKNIIISNNSRNGVTSSFIGRNILEMIESWYSGNQNQGISDLFELVLHEGAWRELDNSGKLIIANAEDILSQTKFITDVTADTSSTYVNAIGQTITSWAAGDALTKASTYDIIGTDTAVSTAPNSSVAITVNGISIAKYNGKLLISFGLGSQNESPAASKTAGYIFGARNMAGDLLGRPLMK